jgi:hypothetical protein
MNLNLLSEIFDQHSPNTPMSEDETKNMIGILFSDNPILNKNVEEFDKESEEYKQVLSIFQVQVFLSRLKALTTLKISFGCLLMLLEHIESPGKGVMYVYYMFKKLPENTFIDINVYTTKLFPLGYFSDEQLSEIWDKQKINKEEAKYLTSVLPFNTDNLVDYKEVWIK